MGGCQGWVRGPSGVVIGEGGDHGGLSWVGEGTKGGFNVNGRRPLMLAKPRLSKRSCLPPQGLEEEPRSGSNF